MTRFLVLIMIYFSQHVFSQNVSGIVTDEDGRPLPAVLVINVSTNQKTTTNLNGEFSIEASPQNELRFVRNGFERNSHIIKEIDFNNPVKVSLLRMIEEIEEVKVSSLKLTGDLNKDSKSLTKIDKTAQVEKAVGIPGPPEKPREKPAEFEKDVLYSLLSLSVKPQAIYDLISGDARRMKAEYRYEDLQENISWIRQRIDDDYFVKMGIPPGKISEFLQFSIGLKPEINQFIKAKNLSKILFILEDTLPVYLHK